MFELRAADGRIAWFCGDDPDLAHEMAAELFPGLEVAVSEVRPPRRSGRSPA